MPYSNPDIKRRKQREYYLKNRDKLLASQILYYNTHQEQSNSRNKARYLTHKDEYIQYAKEWALRNPTKRKAIERKYQNTHFQLHRLLRKRMREAVHSGCSLSVIGCSMIELKNHLQKTAIENGYIDFDISNYNTHQYHIDHIIPCASFNLTCSFHRKLCFNWSNLQILLASENIKKSDKLPDSF
jgi:hypothetical protein